MSSSRSAADRLLELERILAQDKTVARLTADQRGDPVALHLADVPAERIRRFTEALARADGDTDTDRVDALTIRLLLNDYQAAVGHLRAVAHIAASVIDGAAQPVRESQRFVRREEKREENRRAQEKTSSGPHAGS